MQLVVANRGYRAPSRAFAYALRPELLAAPGRDDDVRRALDNRARLHDAAARRLRARALREYILAAGDFDQLAHPADGADLRLVPLLEVDARPAWQARRCAANFLQPALQLAHERGPALCRPHHRREQ